MVHPPSADRAASAPDRAGATVRPAPGERPANPAAQAPPPDADMVEGPTGMPLPIARPPATKSQNAATPPLTNTAQPPQPAPAAAAPVATPNPSPTATAMPHPEIRCETAPIAYTAALAAMTERNAAIAAGTAPERIWLLEHPPVYTAGTSAQPSDLLDPRFEIVAAGRGGKYTYHGPGQRIAYVLLDLNTRGRDVRRFVHALEGWVIATLGDFGVEAWRSDTGVGIWTRDIDGREAKIGAIGVRVRRWVTMHGLSVNLAPDLSHFNGIVPCGIAEAGVTSLARIGRPVTTEAWDAALLARLDGFLAAIATPCGTPAR